MHSSAQGPPQSTCLNQDDCEEMKVRLSDTLLLPDPLDPPVLTKRFKVQIHTSGVLCDHTLGKPPVSSCRRGKARYIRCSLDALLQQNLLPPYIHQSFKTL